MLRSAVVSVMTFSTLFRLSLAILWSDSNAIVRLKLKQFGIPALLNVLNWKFLHVIKMYLRRRKNAKQRLFVKELRFTLEKMAWQAPNSIEILVFTICYIQPTCCTGFFAAARRECILYRLDKLHSAQLDQMSNPRQKFDPNHREIDWS